MTRYKLYFNKNDNVYMKKENVRTPNRFDSK